MTFPKFEGFNITVTPEELAKAKAEREAQFNNRLSVGENELEILVVDYKGPVKNDNTWLNFMLTMHVPGTKPADDGKFRGAVRLNVMVPTSDIRYNDKLNVFGMLQTFFDGLGESLTPSNVGELIPAYFSDPKQLTGLKLKIKLGYKANHIEYRDGKYVVADKAGNLLTTSNGTNGFATKEAALGQAFTDNIVVTTTGSDGKTYDNKIEVISVLPGPKQRAETPKGKKVKASADW